MALPFKFAVHRAVENLVSSHFLRIILRTGIRPNWGCLSNFSPHFLSGPNPPLWGEIWGQPLASGSLPAARPIICMGFLHAHS
jgi:hypothetical protein